MWNWMGIIFTFPYIWFPAFKRVCLLHITQIKKALSIFGTISRVCSWYQPTTSEKKGAQIDLIIDRDDNVIDLCEMKYTKQLYEMTSEKEQKVQNRRSTFIAETGTHKSVHLILVTANGVKSNSYSDEFQSVVTTDALFEK